MSSSKKVFVGNLNYDTLESDLKEAFSKAGNVVEAKIVRRGSRSKGYGFVEFETEEHAKKSVELLDKFGLHDRNINVQLSTSSGTKVGNGTSPYRGQDGPRPSYRNNYRNNYNSYNQSYDNSYDNSYQNRGPSGRGGRKMYFLRNNFNDEYIPRRRNGGGRPPMRRNFNNKPRNTTNTEKN